MQYVRGFVHHRDKAASVERRLLIGPPFSCSRLRRNQTNDIIKKRRALFCQRELYTRIKI